LPTNTASLLGMWSGLILDARRIVISGRGTNKEGGFVEALVSLTVVGAGLVGNGKQSIWGFVGNKGGLEVSSGSCNDSGDFGDRFESSELPSLLDLFDGDLLPSSSPLTV
jgi:hypothetical protein